MLRLALPLRYPRNTRPRRAKRGGGTPKTNHLFCSISKKKMTAYVNQSYINPIKVLAINSFEQEAIISALRQTLAAFDAANGQIKIAQKQIKKADFLHFLDFLKDEKQGQYFLDLYKELPDLDDFLSRGDLCFFEKFDSLLFKCHHFFADTDFLNFIAPYYTSQYQAAIFAAYKDTKNAKLTAVLQGLPLLLSAYEAQGFEKLMAFLQQQLQQLATYLSQLSPSKNTKIAAAIKSLIQIEKLNLLPDYFQPLRNNIAHGICTIGVDFYNEYQNIDLSLAALAMAESITTTDAVAAHIQLNYSSLTQFLEATTAPNTAAEKPTNEAEKPKIQILPLEKSPEKSTTETNFINPISPQKPKQKLSKTAKILLIVLPLFSLLIAYGISEHKAQVLAQEQEQARIQQEQFEEQQRQNRIAEEVRIAEEAAKKRAKEELIAAERRAEEERAAEERTQENNNRDNYYYTTWVSSVRMRDYPSLEAETTYIIPEGANLIGYGEFSNNQATVELRGYSYTAAFVKVYYPDADVQGWVHLATLRDR
jgi:hypothetical protein